ncbi:Na-translocating system protein MpsB [Dyadobacter sp. CY261]|uniref:putative inorganic carbon transporter subunit DabA n=1 Tax=Dyadobacter sp. CY261 TaxID=2907203 RepID=UPI001F17979C|nr:putative inorganic carbon transporter subunit DabA [Dyadobacter sp. CY261]MCF0075047.1 Na-translocating system protein MpsB [Dyadobacter sp. CY261]
MTARNSSFDEQLVLHELKHFLRGLSQPGAFDYSNPLHAFQGHHFHDALRCASEILGYQTTVSMEGYRSLYNAKRVKPEILEKVLIEKKGAANIFEWQDKVLMKKFPAEIAPRIGQLRHNGKNRFKTDLDEVVHQKLFRILDNYLDSGVADWQFPVRGRGFLDSMREVESKSYISIFRTARARNLLLYAGATISDLLAILVGDQSLFEQYLFDQQFAHREWSGLVSSLENNVHHLPDGRTISLHDLIVFELLLEIDALDHRLKSHWQPLATGLTERQEPLFAPLPADERSEVLTIWQEAVEWSYYDQVLSKFYRPTRDDLTYGKPDQIRIEPSEAYADDKGENLCILGTKFFARNLALPLNASRHAYDFAVDRDGDMLGNILEKVVPSCGAANIGNFFAEASLHDNSTVSRIPMRLLCVIEQFPETALKVIRRCTEAYPWFLNEWAHLVVIEPQSHGIQVFKNGKMIAYKADRQLENATD